MILGEKNKHGEILNLKHQKQGEKSVTKSKKKT